FAAIGRSEPEGHGITSMLWLRCEAPRVDPSAPGSRGIRRRIVRLCTGMGATPEAGRRVDGRVQPTEVALDAGGGHDQSTELHTPAAVLAELDVDLEASHQQFMPGAIPRAMGWSAWSSRCKSSSDR